jgi:putative sigma-54 modulation protein
MELKVHYTNLESSPTVDAVILEKADRLKKFFEGKFTVNWTCSIEKERHLSSVSITGKNVDFNAYAESDTMYKTIDLVMEKLEKQLRRKKDRVTNKHHDKLTAVAEFE